jgi:hypothetical protein
MIVYLYFKDKKKCGNCEKMNVFFLNVKYFLKNELHTHMEHLSSCQSGFLVVCASQSSVFWVFVIFCQPLNICLFVMLYLYIYRGQFCPPYF